MKIRYKILTDQGTPDVVTLDAACTSMEKFTDKFRRSYNFVYFMTDGQSGEGSIQAVIKKHKKDMVITGIGMAGEKRLGVIVADKYSHTQQSY